jgi:hypothetical protein
MVAEVQDEYLAWSAGLTPPEMASKVVQMTSLIGESFSVPQGVAVSLTCQAWLLGLAKESGLTYFPKASKSGKPKASLFDDPKKGTKSQLMTGGTEEVEGGAQASYYVKDKTGRLQKLIELIVIGAGYLSRNELVEAARTFEDLTGQNPADTRFNFNDASMKRLWNARLCGIIASTAAQWKKELNEKLKKNEKIKVATEVEQRQFEEMLGAIDRDKNRKELKGETPKVEKIPGSKVASVETKAALPIGTAKPLTAEDIAKKKLEREAKAAAAKATADGEIEDHVGAFEDFVSAYVKRGGPLVDDSEEDDEETEES